MEPLHNFMEQCTKPEKQQIFLTTKEFQKGSLNSRKYDTVVDSVTTTKTISIKTLLAQTCYRDLEQHTYESLDIPWDNSYSIQNEAEFKKFMQEVMEGIPKKYEDLPILSVLYEGDTESEEEEGDKT